MLSAGAFINTLLLFFWIHLDTINNERKFHSKAVKQANDCLITSVCTFCKSQKERFHWIQRGNTWKRPHFGAYVWPKSWKNWVSIKGVQTGPPMEHRSLQEYNIHKSSDIDKTPVSCGRKNWWVKWISIFTNLLVEQKISCQTGT
jgi:hypothetical protein